ncbi:hypothetical protein PSI19_09420 [Xenorhabdus khoisanae]|uniref:hypothetical protein n=1 Tax=Xenorhabdus khoisanae TaxID=880157 RepID=UPI0023587F5A|nr:hypothetical protein [Xenorhabdus khoisanae]MDC9614088.1 hypothetical protein [Xenorhabdus khoisanae]
MNARDVGAQPAGNYLYTDTTREQILSGPLVVDNAFYVTSDGAGSNLMAIVANKGQLGFNCRVGGVYQGLVSLPTQSGTLALMSEVIGIGQKWQNVTSSRRAGTTYTNGTTSPIAVLISGQATGDGTARVFVGGVAIAAIGGISTANIHRQLTFIVPPNTSYRIDHNMQIIDWSELR